MPLFERGGEVGEGVTRFAAGDHVIGWPACARRIPPEWGKVVRDLTGGTGVDLAIEVVGGDLTQTLDLPPR